MTVVTLVLPHLILQPQTWAPIGILCSVTFWPKRETRLHECWRKGKWKNKITDLISKRKITFATLRDSSLVIFFRARNVTRAVSVLALCKQHYRLSFKYSPMSQNLDFLWPVVTLWLLFEALALAFRRREVESPVPNLARIGSEIRNWSPPHPTESSKIPQKFAIEKFIHRMGYFHSDYIYSPKPKCSHSRIGQNPISFQDYSKISHYWVVSLLLGRQAFSVIKALIISLSLRDWSYGLGSFLTVHGRYSVRL